MEKMIRRYITLLDVLNPDPTSIRPEGPFGYTTTDGIKAKMNDAIATINNIQIYVNYDTIASTAFSNINLYNARISTLMADYIYPEFYDSAVTFKDGDDIDYDYYDEIIKFIGRFMPWLNASAERYGRIINEFENRKTTLLDSVKNSSVIKYNDTPQDEGDYSTDEYTSNITTSETSTSIGNDMEKIATLEAFIKDYYEQWSKEFAKKFIIFSAGE